MGERLRFPALHADFFKAIGTLRPDLNDRDGAVAIRSIQPEPVAAFHDPCPKSRHSASGQTTPYGCMVGVPLQAANGISLSRREALGARPGNEIPQGVGCRCLKRSGAPPRFTVLSPERA
jgi:hypothetical protein